ncbi:MAG TPA: FAD binding domain-containing protein, partial [Chloroflexota bacterium]|nr:FAD binding domain-containing protein [Chloroflexota bacterium]
SVRIGALVNHQTLVDSGDIQSRVPLLAETYRHVATVRIRNFATVGGGLAHGDPNQDPQVSLLALGASVQLTSRGGSRTLPLEDFLVDYYETAIKPDELLTELTIPLPAAGTGTAYLKFLPRTADDYATVSAAAVVRVENGVIADARVAFGSAAPTAKRVVEAETMLKGQRPSEGAFRAAAEAARPLCDPVSDARGSASYKTDMVPVFIRRALMQAAERAGAAV